MNTDDFPTVGAVRWLLSRMIMPEVVCEGHAVAERLTTLHTLKVWLVAVTPLVLSKGRTVPEGLATLPALVEPRPSANPPMLSRGAAAWRILDTPYMYMAFLHREFFCVP